MESYPDSKYNNEIKDRIEWLKRLKVGVFTDTSKLPAESDEIKNRINRELKSMIEKLIGGEIVILSGKDDINSDNLSALVSINYNRYESNPERSGKVAEALIMRGLIGYLMEKNTFGSKNIITENWVITIKNGFVKDLNYEKEKRVDTFNEIFNDINFFEQIREAEMITWFAKSNLALKSLNVALEGRDGYFRGEAMQAFLEPARKLSDVKDPRALDVLMMILKEGKWATQIEAAKVLWEIGDERAVEYLISALKDNDPDMRKAAAEALGEIKDERAVEPLIEALKDTNASVLVTAVKALGKIAVEPLITALKDDNPDVRMAAAKSLGELKDNRAVEPLIAALKDNDPYVRSAAAKALGMLDIKILITALNDSNPNVRSAAAGALGDIKDNRAVEPLIIALKDNDPNIRVAAAGALGDIKDNRAVEPLITVFKNDGNHFVRIAVAEALGKIDFERLIKALKDRDLNVRITTAEILGELKDDRAVEPLYWASKKDSNPLVRDTASKSMNEIINKNAK